MRQSQDALIQKTRLFIIRSAFRLTLRRDADSEGLERYLNEFNSGMTTEQLLEDLKKSQEFKAKFGQNTAASPRWQDQIDPSSLRK